MRFYRALFKGCDLRLRIPMRGYEQRNSQTRSARLLVTHPHEGLWEYQVPCHVCKDFRYASPWGVMSFSHTHFHYITILLRIPMRGYESERPLVLICPEKVTHPHEGLWEPLAADWLTRCWRYASPWGVMRLYNLDKIEWVIELRIPMRGYEFVVFPWNKFQR